MDCSAESKCSAVVLKPSVILDLTLKQEVQEVAELTEKVLRILIFRMLEELIHQESADGDFALSSIPTSILNELRLTRKHFFQSTVNEGTDFDQYVLRGVVSCIEGHLQYAARHYHKAFHVLALELDLSSEFNFAYDTFVNVCKKFFEGEVTWYRIASLLGFGAEVALFVIKQGGAGVETFLKKIVHYVVEFVVKEEIADWISSHGGWMTMIDVFDQHNCKDRGNHILTIMALEEITHVDTWLGRIAVVLVITGLCYSLAKFIM